MDEHSGIIRVEEKLFEDLKGKQLLQQVRNGDLDGTHNQLRQVLNYIEKEYGEDDSRKQIRKGLRAKKRQKRIEVYDNLLRIALGAEGGEWTEWRDDYERAKQVWHEKSEKASEKGTIFTYLLDHIYEDEEIMFKYYDKKPCLEKAFWLQQSIHIFRMNLVNPIIDMVKDGSKQDNVCQPLLATAKQAFKEKLSSYGRDLTQRSWRNRARLYWLLARAKHAPISKGEARNFKSFAYSGPMGTLAQELIQDDKDMFLHSPKELLFHYVKEKYDKEDKDLQLGTLRVCSLLAWASAANYHDLVGSILQHKEEYVKSDECDAEWEKEWQTSWADALWNAAYKGNANIVEQLLKCNDLDSKHFCHESTQPPLHVAVRRGHISVVRVFCALSQAHLNCHEEDRKLHQTPLEVATNLNDELTKKTIQNLLLQRDEVNQAVEELYRQRELTVGSANAILVGAALIAGVTYGGWLQPPLGYSTNYQFPEPPPAPPDSFESYMAIDSHVSLQVFAIFNSLSFFCAIAAVVAGMETTCFIDALEETYISNTVRRLRYKLKRTTILFIVSVIFVLVAFGSAGIAILPPIPRYQRTMYITIAVGGFVCLVFLGRMLLICVSKTLFIWVQTRLRWVELGFDST